MHPEPPFLPENRRKFCSNFEISQNKNKLIVLFIMVNVQQYHKSLLVFQRKQAKTKPTKLSYQ